MVPLMSETLLALNIGAAFAVWSAAYATQNLVIALVGCAMWVAMVWVWERLV